MITLAGLEPLISTKVNLTNWLPQLSPPVPAPGNAQECNPLSLVRTKLPCCPCAKKNLAVATGFSVLGRWIWKDCIGHRRVSACFSQLCHAGPISLHGGIMTAVMKILYVKVWKWLLLGLCQPLKGSIAVHDPCTSLHITITMCCFFQYIVKVNNPIFYTDIHE